MNLEEKKYVYRSLSMQIASEFELLGQRMNWLLLSSSFLFSAMAITAGNLSKSDGHDILLIVIAFSIPIVGIFISILSYYSMEVALKVIEEWKRNRRNIEIKIQHELSINFPLTVGVGENFPGHKTGNRPYVFLPWIIFFVWVILLVCLAYLYVWQLIF